MICFEFSLQDNKSMFTISVKDVFGCATYQNNNITINNGCIPFNMIAVNMACASLYYFQIEAYSKIVYRGPITQISGQLSSYQY